MITQREVSQLAFRTQMSDRVIEKDYVLTWLLAGIADSSLADHLAFKGGTALKKIYFPDYRTRRIWTSPSFGRSMRMAFSRRCKKP